jgi:uncharacterized protein (DUF952 family)
MLVFKVLRADEWEAFQAAGSTFGAPADLADGFIHFSTGAQLGETLRRHFAGEADLFLAAINAGSAGAALRWEPSRGGDLFPHLYRPLHLSDIVWICPLDSSDAFLSGKEDQA